MKTRTTDEVVKRGASPKGFECTIVRERTPDTENKFHFGRRGLSKAQVLAGKVGTGQGQGRWTPSLDRAEAIFALYMRDVIRAREFRRQQG